MSTIPIKIRRYKKTVLAVGEGESEKIFIRHLANLYCRKNEVSISSSSAGGSAPEHILDYAIKFRRDLKRDKEFILLDTDNEWTEEFVEKAKKEDIELIGSSPCFESFLLDILSSPNTCDGIGSGRCKSLFEDECRNRRFDEDECARLFPKPLLNDSRNRITKLDKIIKIFEGIFD